MAHGRDANIMMVGTAPGNGGGIAAVVWGYLESGTAERLGIDYYPTHRPGGVLDKITFYLRGLANIAFKMGRYRIVHVQTASYWSFRRLFFVILLARLRRKILVIHLHGGQFDEYCRHALPPERWCIKWAFAGAHRVVLLAEHLRGKIHGLCPPEHCLIIPNGVSLPDPSGDPAIHHRKQHTILFLGDIVKRKGVYDLVDAVSRMNTTMPFEVIMAGNGEIAEVSAHAEVKHVKARFTFPGWVSGSEKERLLSSASIFVLPSHAESMPMSILEAMAAGVPVVAANVGGIPEVIRDGLEGKLFQPGDVEGLAQALQDLLDDETGRHIMSRSCRARIQERFSAQRTEDALGKLYLDLGSGSISV